VEVTVLNDSLKEGPESIAFELSNVGGAEPVPGGLAGTRITGTVTDAVPISDPGSRGVATDHETATPPAAAPVPDLDPATAPDPDGINVASGAKQYLSECVSDSTSAGCRACVLKNRDPAFHVRTGT
jgi:hypothetical protein